MKKRERIFLEALVLSLTVILISTTIAHYAYPSIFEMSPSGKMCFEQEREPGIGDCLGQNLAFTSIALKFGSIRNAIRVDAEASCYPTWIFSAEPKSITAPILFHSLIRASPP